MIDSEIILYPTYLIYLNFVNVINVDSQCVTLQECGFTDV